MSEESNDVTVAAIDNDQLPLRDDEAKMTGAERSPPADKDDNGGDGVLSADHPNKKRSAKPNRKQIIKNGKRKNDDAALASPSSFRDRLLATIRLPAVKIDPTCLPAGLRDALQAANLTDEQNLSLATFAALTAITAVAGNIKCIIERPMPELSISDGRSLRLAVVAQRHMPMIVSPHIIGAAYAAESDALDEYSAQVQQIEQARRSSDQLRRLREQAARAGIDLGADIPQSDGTSNKPGPRPRIVIVDGAESAIRTAAAGGTGLVIIDDRRTPWLANIGSNFDYGTDGLLNMVAAGYPIPVNDPTTGRVSMTSITTGVIGALDLSDCDALCKCNNAQLAGTIFMPGSIPPADGNSAKLDALLRRVRKLGLEGLTFRLPGDACASAVKAWTEAAADLQPPLANVVAGAPDLARRLAIAMHLAGLDEGTAGLTIPAKTAASAIRLVDDAVLPVARALLGPCSVPQVENDARRVVAYLRTNSSPADRTFERRALLRSWQRSMTAIRLDAAIAVLTEAELLIPTEGDGRVVVAPAVFGM